MVDGLHLLTANAAPRTGLRAIANAEGAAVDQKALATARSFEAFFLSQMLEQMTAGIETDGPFGGGQSEKLYRSMLNQQYARHLSEAGGIGLADAIYAELIKAQESLTS